MAYIYKGPNRFPLQPPKGLTAKECANIMGICSMGLNNSNPMWESQDPVCVGGQCNACIPITKDTGVCGMIPGVFEWIRKEIWKN